MTSAVTTSGRGLLRPAPPSATTSRYRAPAPGPIGQLTPVPPRPQ